MQEAYAQNIASGEFKTITDAYITAYKPKKGNKKTIAETASRVKRLPKVMERIKELQDAAAERNSVTQDTIISMLQEAFDLGKEKRQPMAMTNAAMGLARVCGHLAPTEFRNVGDTTAEVEAARNRVKAAREQTPLHLVEAQE
jgi:hypothetical protein